MLVQLRAEPDDDVLTTLDLYEWLRKDPDVRGHAELSLVSSDPTGEAMGATEVVNLVLGQTFTALNLALAYASWRAARQTAPAVTITVDGRSITVRGASDETVLRIVELLRDPQTDGAPDPQRDGSDGRPGDDTPEPV